MSDIDFVKFDSIKRLSRGCTITEKIDGTNAQILIVNRALVPEEELANPTIPFMCVDNYLIVPGSRNRYISADKDNYGFGRWVSENREELVESLGEGRHYGEWWGQGIQRRYDMGNKVFSLFNVNRWKEDSKPECCSVVPVLYEGLFDTTVVDKVLEELALSGSVAAHGFSKPEGIVVFHHATRSLFKKTLDANDEHKGLV